MSTDDDYDNNEGDHNNNNNDKISSMIPHWNLMMTSTTTMTKIINLCSINCDTSLESQDQKDLESDYGDNNDKNHIPFFSIKCDTSLELQDGRHLESDNCHHQIWNLTMMTMTSTTMTSTTTLTRIKTKINLMS